MIDNDNEGAALKAELRERFLDAYEWYDIPYRKVLEMTGLTMRTLGDIQEGRLGHFSTWQIIRVTAALGCSVILIANQRETIVAVDGEQKVIAGGRLK